MEEFDGQEWKDSGWGWLQRRLVSEGRRELRTAPRHSELLLTAWPTLRNVCLGGKWCKTKCSPAKVSLLSKPRLDPWSWKYPFSFYALLGHRTLWGDWGSQDFISLKRSLVMTFSTTLPATTARVVGCPGTKTHKLLPNSTGGNFFLLTLVHQFLPSLNPVCSRRFLKNNIQKVLQ